LILADRRMKASR